MWNRTPEAVERQVLGAATPERDRHPHERQPFRHGDRGTWDGKGAPAWPFWRPVPLQPPHTSSCVSRRAWHALTAAPGWQPHPRGRGPRADEGWARLGRSPPAGGLRAPLTTLSWVSGPLTCRRGIYQAARTTRATSLKQILSTHPVSSVSPGSPVFIDWCEPSLAGGREGGLGSDITAPMSRGSFSKICHETRGMAAPGTRRGQSQEHPGTEKTFPGS